MVRDDIHRSAFALAEVGAGEDEIGQDEQHAAARHDDEVDILLQTREQRDKERERRHKEQHRAVERGNDLIIAVMQLHRFFAEEDDHNFCINTSMKREGGLQLQIGGGSQNSDVEGCFNIYHYITKDMLRLGLAYADVVLENGMLD